MNENNEMLEPLFKRLEVYAKTSFDLNRLKAVNKLSLIVSNLVSKNIFVLILFITLANINIGAAFLIGKFVNDISIGFFCIAGVYFFVGGFLYLLFKNKIKKMIENKIIFKFLN